MEDVFKIILPTLVASLQAAGVFGGVIMGGLYFLARRDLRDARKEIRELQAERIAEGKKALEVFEASIAGANRRREADENTSALFTLIARLLPTADPRLAAIITNQVDQCWPPKSPTLPSPGSRP